MKNETKTIYLLIIISLEFLLSPCNAAHNKEINNIILITIDTLRADHLSCYGYSRKTTPFIDSLANNGIIFKQAFSQSSTTEPSHASLFTSFYPFQHNVLDNYQVLDDKFLTLAEILSEHSYNTGAFTSNQLFLKTNFQQGFQTFKPFSDDLFDKHTIKAKHDSIIYRPGQLTIKEALSWFKEHKQSKKMFAWVHLFDAHQPYVKHKKELNKIKIKSDKDYPFHKAPVNFSLYQRKIMETKTLGTEITDNHYINFKEAFNAYDSEIRKIDNDLNDFYKALKKLGRLKNTLIIITSDHGECLGNHNWPGHSKNIYNEAIHIPLIFHFTNKDYKGTVIDQNVEHVDFLPTLLDLLGENYKEILPKNIEGISLLSLLNNKSNNYNKRFSFAMRKKYFTYSPPESPDIHNFEEGNKYSVQDKDYKYILWTEGKHEFYNLREDPYELNNLINKSIKEKDLYKQTLLDKINGLKGEISSKSNETNTGGSLVVK